MIERFKIWFSGRSAREQYLLGVAAGLALLMLIIFGMILPGFNAIGSAEKELDAATKRRGNIEASVALAKANSGSPAVAVVASGASLESVISSSATASGFEIADGAAIGVDEYRFRLASIKAGALFAWLTGLEAQGIELAQISVRKGEGGFVTAEIRLRRKP